MYKRQLPDYVRKERDIENGFQDINKCMTMMVTRSHWENGNYFTFKHFYQILDALDQVIIVLEKVELQRTAYAEYRMLKALSVRVDLVRSELQQMGVGQGNILVGTGNEIMG